MLPATNRPGGPEMATHRVELGLQLDDALASTWVVDVGAGDDWRVIAGAETALDAPALSGLSAARVAVDLAAPQGDGAWLVLQVTARDLELRKDPRNWRLYFRRQGAALVPTPTATTRTES